jgi:hypothetical protein
MQQYFLRQIFTILQKTKKAQVTGQLDFLKNIFKIPDFYEAMKLQKNWQISRSLPRNPQDLDSRSPKCSRTPNFSTPLFSCSQI